MDMAYLNQWKELEKEYHCNQRLSSTISCIVDFGIFVDLHKGINGIVHLNDIDWETSGEKAICCYNVGDSIEVIILSIDPERERVSLGIKQLTPDPREDRDEEPPTPAPMKPKGPGPKPLKPLSDVVQH